MDCVVFDVQIVIHVDGEDILMSTLESVMRWRRELLINIQWIKLSWRSAKENYEFKREDDTHTDEKFLTLCFQKLIKLSFKLICLDILFKYLQVGDLKGAIFHHTDSTIVSQDPLAIFLPLDAGYGVAHDVAV